MSNKIASMLGGKYRFSWYNWVVVSVFVVALLVIVSVGFYLQPLVGNLTRMGGYSENAFGWNGTEYKVKDAAVSYTDKRMDYDVVIFGDSFSNKKHGQTHPGSFWQNWLWARTGFSSMVFNRNRVDVPAVIDQFLSRKQPPKLIVYEMLMSDMDEVVEFGDEQCALQERPLPSPSRIQHQIAEIVGFERPDSGFASLLQFNQAVSVLKHGFQRNFLSISGRVRAYNLDNTGYFSNDASGVLLVNAGDLDYYGWRKRGIDQSICGLKMLQNRMQTGSGTYGVILLVPDKLQVYREFVDSAELMGTDWYAYIAGTKGLHLPRLDLAIGDALQQGVKDLYLPDDTHWGSRGHQVAADVLVDYLLEQGVIQAAEGAGTVD